MGFCGYLQANTVVDVLIGPFVDDTDGKTAETALTISQADVKLSKNGGALAQKNDADSAAHDAGGYYKCDLNATDTNTEGTLTLIVNESGALPVRHDFMVLAQAAYTSLVTAKDSGYMDVNVKAVSEDTTAADNAEAFFDGTGYAGTNNVIPTVTTLTGHTAQTGDAYAIVNNGTYGNAKLVRSTTPANALTVDASGLVAVPETQRVLLANSNDHGGATAGITLNGAAGLTSTTGIAAAITGNVTGNLSGSVGSVAANGITNASFNADVGTTAYVGNPIALAAKKAIDEYDPPTKAELDTAVADVSVDEIQASAIADLFNTDSGTDYAAAVAGSAVKEIADNAGGSALTLNDIADAVWDEALAGHTAAGSSGKALADAGSAGDPWSTAIPGAYGAGTAGKILGDNINAPIATVDTVVDAIKAKTDSLTFTVAGDVDCNVQTWKGAAAPDMTGDAFARLGAPAGASISADISGLNDITVADIIAGIADGGYDLQEMVRIMFAALAGKASGGGTATLTFRDSADGKDRITATVDANGNRTAMSLDGS